MSRMQILVPAAVSSLVALCGCQPGQVPGTAAGGLNGSWIVNSATDNQIVEIGSPNASVLIKQQGTYVVTFLGSSPIGIKRLSWSGTGAFYCQTGIPGEPGSTNAGTEPGVWPPVSTTFSPPGTPRALFNPSFTVPCTMAGTQGPSGYAHLGSFETVTATAADGTGTLRATLNLNVAPTGGL